MDIYARLDAANRGGDDYKLYKVSGGTVQDATSQVTVGTLGTDETFGIDNVQVNAGETYIVAYKRKNVVHIGGVRPYLATSDPNRDINEDIEVPEGSSLEDVAAYTALGFDTSIIHDSPATDGRKFKFKGLYKTPNPGNNAVAFTTSDTIIEGTTLYAVYEVHEFRQTELDALQAKIDEIEQTITDNPTLSAAEKANLRAVKLAATNLKNQRNPIATIAQLNTMTNTTIPQAIQQAIDSLGKAREVAELDGLLRGPFAQILADTTKPITQDDRNTLDNLKTQAENALANSASTEADIRTIKEALRAAIDAAEARANKIADINALINQLTTLSSNPKLSNSDRQLITNRITSAQAELAKTVSTHGSQATMAELDTEKTQLEAALRYIRNVINSSSGGSGGGSGGSGGGGGNSGAGGLGGPEAKNAFVAGITYKTYRNQTEGNWIQTAEGKWNFVLPSSQQPLKNVWAAVIYGSGTGESQSVYAFDAEGNMRSGWIQDEKGIWYFMSDTQDSSYGAMVRGWIMTGGKWYYLSPVNGSMLTGWQEIEGKWYLLAGDGSLYVNTTTPDGFPVDSNGAWIRETP